MVRIQNLSLFIFSLGLIYCLPLHGFNCLTGLPKRSLKQLDHEDTHHLIQLLKFALPEDETVLNEAKQSWVSYKNARNNHPRQWTLSWKDTEEMAPSGNMSLYEQKVILMRRGDTVEVDRFGASLIGKRKITLGKFLGRGNTFHVYAVEGENELVVRISFLAENLFDRSQMTSSQKYLSTLRDEMKSQIAHMGYLGKGPKVAPVRKKYDGGIVLLQKRVHGSETGIDFTNSHSDIIAHLRSEDLPLEELTPKLIELGKKYGFEKESLFREFVEKYRKLMKALATHDKGDERWGISKNLIWDERDRDWFLVDGGPSAFSSYGLVL